MTIILGIDPGSRITGYGVIVSNNNQFTHLVHGCIRTSDPNFSQRLQQIFAGIEAIVQQYQPVEVSIEQVFLARNAASALKLGQARGAAITAVANQAIPVAEYSARQIKQAVVGYGAAKKDQVQHMVKCLLNLSQPLQADAADALAIAICHANNRSGLAALVATRSRVRKRARSWRRAV